MPMAVFVNLAVYVVYSEIGSSPVAGGLALMAVAVLAVQGRIGLMGSTLLAAGPICVQAHPSVAAPPSP